MVKATQCDSARLDLVHFGSDKYNPRQHRPVTGTAHTYSGTKPNGGLWASLANSKCGWKNWCEREEWGDLTKKFAFTFVGRLLVVDSVKDMLLLPWVKEKGQPRYIDFIEIVKSYDAMLVTQKGEHETRYTFPESLYGWDCESIVIFNPDCIIIQS